jgi:hypothetical protein
VLTGVSSTGTEYEVANGRQRLHFGRERSLIASSRKSARKDNEYLLNYLILNDFIEWIKKVGADNKPGSVIDNHSSGTAVTDCL